MLNKPTSITLTSPIGGLADHLSRMTPDPKFTFGCLDVLPWSRSMRNRISQRPGTTTGSAVTLGAGNTQCFIQATYVSGGASASRLYAVGGCPSAGAGMGNVYTIAAGVVKETIVSSGATGTLAQVGAVAVPTGFLGCTLWRGRLVLFGPDHIWKMSRAGTPGDWDNSQSDPAAAVYGTDYNSRPGATMDTIIAAIPYNNDTLIFGGDHTMYACQGDPRFGGSVNLLNMGVGIMGPSAYTIAPDGAIYIITTGGVYRSFGGPFEPLSGKKNLPWFQSINRTSNIVSTAFDRDRNGLWVFAKGLTTQFYDIESNAFWPQSFASNTNAAYVFDGNAPADRYIVLAQGTAISAIGNTQTADSGSAMSAYVWIGPVMPAGPVDEAKLRRLSIVMGDVPTGFSSTQFRGNYTLNVGKDPATTMTNPEQTFTGSFTGSNRAADLSIRATGTCFMLKLSTAASYDPGGGTVNPFFEFESATFEFEPAGRGRL